MDWNFSFTYRINSIPIKVDWGKEKINYKMMRKPSSKVSIFKTLKQVTNKSYWMKVLEIGKIILFHSFHQCDRSYIQSNFPRLVLIEEWFYFVTIKVWKCCFYDKYFLFTISNLWIAQLLSVVSIKCFKFFSQLLLFVSYCNSTTDWNWAWF